MFLVPFISYTMITNRSRLSSDQDLLSGTHPFLSLIVICNNQINLFSGGNSLYYMNNKLKSIIDENKDTLEVCLLGAHFARRKNLKFSNINFFLKSGSMWTLKSIMSNKCVIEININELKQILSSDSNSSDISNFSEDLQKQLIVKNFGDVILSVKELDLNFPAFSSNESLLIQISNDARKSLLGLLNI